MSGTDLSSQAKEIAAEMTKAATALSESYKNDEIEEAAVLVELGKLLQMKKNFLKIFDKISESGHRLPGSFSYWHFLLKSIDTDINEAQGWADAWITLLATEKVLALRLNTLSFSMQTFARYVERRL